MNQQAAVFVGPTVVQIELPAANVELLPGLCWGAVEAFPTPAYWAYQVVAHRVLAGPHRHRLGRTLDEEVVACLLGGHGIPADVGLAAFRHLRSSGVLQGTPTAADVYEALRTPLAIHGRSVHYRFASKKATFVADALRALAGATPPQNDGRTLRDWLLRLDGVGYKTASWVARNWLDANDVAILDIHVMRAGAIGGFLDGTLTVADDYLALEQQFLTFCGALGVRASELDAIIWNEMALSPRTVRRLLATSPCPGSGRLGARPRPSNVRRSDSLQARLVE